MSLPDEFIQSGAMQTGMSSSIEYVNGRQKAIRYNYRTFTGYFEDVGTYLMGPVKVITRTKEYLSEEYKVRVTNRQNMRSEEHTSELQSRPHLVCRLLLEKKKNQ